MAASIFAAWKREWMATETWLMTRQLQHSHTNRCVLASRVGTGCPTPARLPGGTSSSWHVPSSHN